MTRLLTKTELNNLIDLRTVKRITPKIINQYQSHIRTNLETPLWHAHQWRIGFVNIPKDA